MTRLTGRVAFITGVARGQGRSHAVRLAAEGADIIGMDLCADLASVTTYALATPDDLDRTRALVEEQGRRFIGFIGDVRDRGGLEAGLAAGVAELGRLDIVCANAGIFSFGEAHEMTEETWLETIEVDLSGVWRTADVAVPHLIASGGGSIIMIGSTASMKGYPNLAHYVAAKHGVIGVMRTLALDLAAHFIRVNAVCPAQVDTPMFHNPAMYSVWCPGVEQPTDEDFRRASAATMPLPTVWLDCAEVSAVVAFLASDEARSITGVALPVDAGTLLR